MDRYVMTSSTISSVNDNERMDPTHPRPDGPRRRRAFTASDKLAHLHAYEQACEHGDGGAYLRREGLYSSLICEWRKQRDAGVLAGKRPGERVGKLRETFYLQHQVGDPMDVATTEPKLFFTRIAAHFCAPISCS